MWHQRPQTPTPLVRVTPSSHTTDILEAAACTSAEDVSECTHKILVYWDVIATPSEQSLFWVTNAGPLPSSHLSTRERLLARDQLGVQHAQWVTSYIVVMSVSPPHPHLQKGGNTGPMAPTPAIIPQVLSPSLSKARPPTPACLMKTASPQQKQSLCSPFPAIPRRGGTSLAEHRAATVLQCWKRCFWLRHWFDQQALLKQKRLRLHALCLSLIHI